MMAKEGRKKKVGAFSHLLDRRGLFVRFPGASKWLMKGKQWEGRQTGRQA